MPGEIYKAKKECRSELKIVPYNARRKETKEKGTIRELLCAKWDSGLNRTEKIVAIGINPSTAQDGESDMTMTKLCRFLDLYGFNNVIMLNLFESVSPEQGGIVKAARTDFHEKGRFLTKRISSCLYGGLADTGNIRRKQGLF